jgi:predicted Zn-dependent protease
MRTLVRRELLTTCCRAARRCGGGGVVLILLALLEEHAAVAGVPLNGRSQHMVFSSAQIQNIAATSYDERLEKLKQRGQLDRDPALVGRVRRIAQGIIDQAILMKPEAAHWTWEIHVTSNKEVDAYCMAGGKILAGEDFVRRFSDDELAALLSHEIAHAIAEHVREQLSAVTELKPAYARLGLEDVIALLGWDLSVTLKLAPLSRLQELEADDIGIYLAARAGHDPRALLEFYRALGRMDDNSDFFLSHGATDQRLQAVENFVAYAEPLYRTSLATSRASSPATH